jgi:ribose/xylose/arabinose/galactoside ABC-type transport system permease subunit
MKSDTAARAETVTERRRGELIWSRLPSVRVSDAFRSTIPLILAIVALGVIGRSGSAEFLTTRNLQNLLEQMAVLGVLSVGQTFLMVAGLLDLSVASGATLVTIVLAKLLIHHHNEYWAVVVCLGLGLLIGLITGVIVALTRVAPFILTLGGLSILASIALILSGQQPIPTGLVLSSLDVNTWLGIPLPAWCFAGMLVLGAAILRYTRLGRNAYAIGSNEEATYLSGVSIGWAKVGLYALNGLAVGLAGILLVARLGAGDPTAGSGLELQAIAAVVLGGASLGGGRGTMLGTFLGVFLLEEISNALTLSGVRSFYQQMVLGGVLVIAVITITLLERRRESGRRLRDQLRRLARSGDR